MNFMIKIAVRILMVMAVQPTFAELLIVKRVNNQFVPLDAADIATHGAAMNSIILKYTWPMCIASSLTPQEQNELLAPNEPRAEEIFIQKKIQQVVGTDY